MKTLHNYRWKPDPRITWSRSVALMRCWLPLPVATGAAAVAVYFHCMSPQGWLLGAVENKDQKQWKTHKALPTVHSVPGSQRHFQKQHSQGSEYPREVVIIIATEFPRITPLHGTSLFNIQQFYKPHWNQVQLCQSTCKTRQISHQPWCSYWTAFLERPMGWLQ